MTSHRPLLGSFVASFAALALAACSGKLDPGGPSTGAGSSGGGTSSSGGSSSAGSGSGGSSGGGSGSGGSSSGGNTCVDVDLSTYDLSCNEAADCVVITAGEICDGDCTCGGATINVSGQARYQSAISSIQLGLCGCPLEGTPECLGHVCTVCTGAPSDPAPCHSSAIDAGACVVIDPTTYDQTCQVDSDCVGITPGTVCTGDCQCGGAAINSDGLARYETAVHQLGTSPGCPCASELVVCHQNQCINCGPEGCPDGG